jgi:hypothetical protein
MIKVEMHVSEETQQLALKLHRLLGMPTITDVVVLGLQRLCEGVEEVGYWGEEHEHDYDAFARAEARAKALGTIPGALPFP